MEQTVLGRIHSMESFGSADGPGVRFLIFLKGCNMRCAYCHNPDTWNLEGAQEMTADEVLLKALRYKSYWGKNGGITVSGGEALLQIDFLLDLFSKAKTKGIHTCLDTSGNPYQNKGPWHDKFLKLLSVTDLFLLDLKMMDSVKHKELTGCDNANILAMARELSNRSKAMWIRRVIVPGVTDDEEELLALKVFTDSLNTVERIELLPYHTLGVFKWEELGIPYRLDEVAPPTEEQMRRAKEIIGLS